MMDALLRSRDGTLDEHNRTAFAVPLPAVDHPNAMARWEPWVRAYIALQELLAPLSFSALPAGAAPGAATGMALSWRGASSTHAVAELIRPTATIFAGQLVLVLDWAELREERMTEILAQIDPQYAFWASITGMRADRHRHTMELINVALQFAVYAEMRFKHSLACWRPVDLSAQVQPVITTPGHGSLPSGHATQAYTVAEVLCALCGWAAGGTRHEQLQRLSARIATNRVIAGVHFPVDSLAGRLLGQTFGEYVVARCRPGGGSWTPRRFDGSKVDPSDDFHPSQQPLAGADAPAFNEALPAGGVGCPETPLLAWLWQRAAAEWGTP
ncbi:MAG: phosphatase PAP2 family protein [Burkholderiaceae bacterium]|nr:phosphatase PAP2 family protein [Burkholderiaceae bacterium]